MAKRPNQLARIGSALARVVVLAGCTKGGQFDPSEIFSSDMFDSKKKLQGQREPVFPEGVPGTTTGVPQDLVKGYQPPPEPAENAEAAPPVEEKPKPKPKPKVARAPDAATAQKPPKRTQITVGRGSAQPAAPAEAGQAQQSAWPAASQSAPPQQTAGQSQSVWPSPQQAAQPAQSQSVWPNPSAPATSH